MTLAAVVTSPLRRARQTAAAIVHATGAPLSLDDRLIDRDYGAWAGNSAADVARRFGTIDAAPGVEPTDTFTVRVVAAVVAATDQWPGLAVALIAHDAVNRHAIAALVTGAPPAGEIVQRTGCWNRLVRHPAGWSAEVLDAVPT